MLPLSDRAMAVLQGSYRFRRTIDAWYDGNLLADDLPVSEASEEVDLANKVPERITLTVPREDRGVNWSPTTYDHPLAANGQRLVVSLGVDVGNGEYETIQRGVYLVSESKRQGDSISVTATGLLALIDEARLVSPMQPSGTLASTLRALVEPNLTVVVDTTLADRPVPANVNFSDDRLQAVLDLLDAWPATARVDPQGFLSCTSATPATVPVLELTDGKGGTVITTTGTSTRADAYNCVVAQGTDPSGNEVRGVAYMTGYRAVGGPFNAAAVPYFFQSPLLTSNAQCIAAARTIAARMQTQTAISFEVEMVPHLGLQGGDLVSVTADDYDHLLCTVRRLTLPYQPSGTQTLTVASLS